MSTAELASATRADAPPRIKLGWIIGPRHDLLWLIGGYALFLRIPPC